MSTLKQRFLLVSDMHYTTEETAAQLKLTHPKAIASAAAGNAFGKTQREKIETIHTAPFKDKTGVLQNAKNIRQNP